MEIKTTPSMRLAPPGVRLVPPSEMAKITGHRFSPSHQLKLEKRGEHPRRVWLSPKIYAYIESELIEHARKRIEQRDNPREEEKKRAQAAHYRALAAKRKRFGRLPKDGKRKTVAKRRKAKGVAEERAP